MDQVTLTYEQFLSFTRWSEKHASKKTQSERVAKLESMGMQAITIEGRGKKASYSFMIPSGFWRMILIPSMAYSEVGADYMDYLINGQDVQNTKHGNFVRFSIELQDELALKHGLEVESVKKTCQRIKKHLSEHGYINTDAEASKTHRVRIGGTWITDEAAIGYDQKARGIWQSYFKSRLAAYKEIDPDATQLPLDIFREELSQKYRFEMKDELGVDYYRIAKKQHVTDQLTNDINYVRWSFMQSMNLADVLEELNRRQAIYRQQMAQKQTQEVPQQKSTLSMKERIHIQQKTEAIQFLQEHPAPKDTPEEAERKRQEWMTGLASVFGWDLEKLNKQD